MRKRHPDNPVDFVNEVEKFSGSGLKMKAELLLIVQESEKNNRQNVFEDLIFTAKYVMELMRTTRDASENYELANQDYVKKNFSANLQKIISLLKQILSSSEDQAKNYFEQKYFILKDEALFSMNELLSDLEWIEEYLNKYKRKIMS